MHFEKNTLLCEVYLVCTMVHHTHKSIVIFFPQCNTVSNLAHILKIADKPSINVLMNSGLSLNLGRSVHP